MRYAAEFRRAWKGASGQAIDAGKKLLGYLANQKRLSGVDSLVKRITLDDGTIVEARWDMNIPTVRIYPGGSEESACELYVESGLLDLGPNIASDANERFNRGLPEFDDSPATLHFGDDVTCADGVEGLNGGVFITQRQITSQCLPSAGPSVTSRLTSPIKKQAQAVLPASCWSGLMQRYVQAVYGGGALDYSATASALTIGGNTIAVADSIGLIRMGAGLAFIVIDGESLTLRAVTPSNACFEAVMQAWHGLPESTDAERITKARLLTIGLSGCVIGDVLATGTISASGNRHFPHRAAWVFSHGQPKAVAVLESDGVARCYEATFSLEDSTVSASVSTLASGNVFNTDSWPLLCASKSAWDSPGQQVSDFASAAEHLLPGDTYDFPVYAHYEDSTVRIARYALVAETQSVADVSECFSEAFDTLSNDYKGFVKGTVIFREPGGGIDASKQCASSSKGAALVALGYYGTGWSSVIQESALIDDDGRLHAESETGVRAIASDMEPVDFTQSNATTTFAIPDAPRLYAFGAWTFTGVGDGVFECRYENNVDVSTFSDPSYTLTPDNDPCVTTYNPTSLFSGTSTITTTYTVVDAFLFRGAARTASSHVLSLPWGCHDVLTCERYACLGGRGDFAAIHGWTTYVQTSWSVYFTPGPFISAFSGTRTVSISSYPIPGDCGTPPIGAGSTTQAIDLSNTRPAPTGTVMVAMSGVLSVGADDDDSTIEYQKVGDYDSRYTYIQPKMVRGIERFYMVVAADSVTTASATRDVSLETDESPDGADTYEIVGTPSVTCDYYEYAGLQELDDDHIETDLASGNDRAWALQAGTDWLNQGFAYQAARSLLRAQIAPNASLNRGASIGMDRQSITHGYPTVQTPSFVGWA